MAALFQLTTSTKKEIPLIHISGEITSEAEDELVQCYNDIPREKKDRVILDFSDTKYINSAGIAILIGLITKATDKKYNLVVTKSGGSTKIIRLLNPMVITTVRFKHTGLNLNL